MSRVREKHLTPQGGTPFVAFLQMLQELTHLQDIYYLPASKQKKYMRYSTSHKTRPKTLVAEFGKER